MSVNELEKGLLAPAVDRMPIAVAPLKLGDVFRAAKTCEAAFRNDPLVRYANNRKGEPSFMVKMVNRANISAYLVTCIRTDVIALTVDSGLANITIKPPPECSEEPKEDPVLRLAEWILAALRLWRLDKDPETLKV
ncbi:hypothetical protein DXG01_016233 [Tephrocybe rancida]|nr:hypothetical protein DXG01_016233 [Tephrocybe rancida]